MIRTLSLEEVDLVVGGFDAVQCALGTIGGAGMGALGGAAAGSAVPFIGTVGGAGLGAIFGGMGGAAASCFS